MTTVVPADEKQLQVKHKAVEGFILTLDHLLRSLRAVFPDCEKTFKIQTEFGVGRHSYDLMASKLVEWQNLIGPHYPLFRDRQLAELLFLQLPIFEDLDLPDKLKDPRFNAESVENLFKCAENMNRCCERYVLGHTTVATAKPKPVVAPPPVTDGGGGGSIADLISSLMQPGNDTALNEPELKALLPEKLINTFRKMKEAMPAAANKRLTAKLTARMSALTTKGADAGGRDATGPANILQQLDVMSFMEDFSTMFTSDEIQEVIEKVPATLADDLNPTELLSIMGNVQQSLSASGQLPDGASALLNENMMQSLMKAAAAGVVGGGGVGEEKK